MFKIDNEKTIHLTRGDIAIIEVKATTEDETEYIFQVKDVVRLKVFEKKNCESIVLQKDVTVETEQTSVTINLSGENTKIGEIINKPKDYWYEVELNPDTRPQTIIGYDDSGEKIFRIYPEGVDIE